MPTNQGHSIAYYETLRQLMDEMAVIRNGRHSIITATQLQRSPRNLPIEIISTPEDRSAFMVDYLDKIPPLNYPVYKEIPSPVISCGNPILETLEAP